MGTALRKAQKRAAKVQVMNKAIDVGGAYGVAARQAKKVLSNTWIRREASPGKFHKPNNVNGKAFVLNRTRSHLVTSL